MAVVVLDVAVQDATKLPTPGDQELVQALPAHGADPALGVGVGVGGLDRCQDALGTHRTPDVVEGPGELAVAVTDREPDDRGRLIRHGDEAAACWATQAPVGWR
jgi:hypothetical protein